MSKIICFFKNFLLDLIPVLGGIIGKISLVSSFALIWAEELNIRRPNFVFDNVRLEMIIGSFITLIIAIFIPNTAPTGTLSPLIVLIPSMAGFGVHPFILSLLVGIIGVLSIKTNLFNMLISLSGDICKISLTLMFGISGFILCIQKLIFFFENRLFPMVLLILILGIAYILLYIYKKTWFIIPIAAGVSLAVSWLYGIKIDISSSIRAIKFNPIYLWGDIWGIGFGLNTITVLKTLPFALFVILLWTIDTISIQTVISTGYKENENRQELNIRNSFIAVSIRNIIGGLFGGAQTGSLWRSFLIPLYMVKRPLRQASIMLGVLGVVVAIIAFPIRILSFPPLVWSVLLFGIFIPFINTGLKSFKNTYKFTQKLIIVILAVVGIIFSPILTWLGGILYEKMEN